MRSRASFLARLLSSTGCALCRLCCTHEPYGESHSVSKRKLQEQRQSTIQCFQVGIVRERGACVFQKPGVPRKIMGPAYVLPRSSNSCIPRIVSTSEVAHFINMAYAPHLICAF